MHAKKLKIMDHPSQYIMIILEVLGTLIDDDRKW